MAFYVVVMKWYGMTPAVQVPSELHIVDIFWDGLLLPAGYLCTKGLTGTPSCISVIQFTTSLCIVLP